MSLPEIRRSLEIGYRNMATVLGLDTPGAFQEDGGTLTWTHGSNCVQMRLDGDHLHVSGQVRGTDFAPFTERYGGMREYCLHQVLRCIETTLIATHPHTYRYVFVTWAGTDTYDRADAIPAERVGVAKLLPMQSPYFQGCPKFKDILGPMSPRRIGDVVEVRYEDQRTYNMLSM